MGAKAIRREMAGSSTMPLEEKKNLPCCGVASVAMLAEVDFDTAWNACAKFQSVKRADEWKGSTTAMDRSEALSYLGLKPYTEFASSFFHLGSKSLSLKRAIRENYFDPSKVYLVSTKGHAQIVHNGLIFDQNNPEGADPETHWQGRKYIILIQVAEKFIEEPIKQEPEQGDNIKVEIVVGNKSYGWETATFRGYTAKGRIQVIHKNKRKAFDPKRVSFGYNPNVTPEPEPEPQRVKVALVVGNSFKGYDVGNFSGYTASGKIRVKFDDGKVSSFKPERVEWM